MVEYCRAVVGLLRVERGQALSEYALIFAFVVLVGITMLGLLALGMGSPYQTLRDALPG